MFTAPLWLLGLAVLGIPLALHLWSRRPRSLIRVGSLRHLSDLPEARTWSTRLTDPLLLACRLAILTCIVLALAGPRLALPPVGLNPRLVLVEPALLADSAFLLDPVLDSLVRRGASVRLLQPGLPELGSQFPVSSSGRRRAPIATRNWEPGTGNFSLWALIAEADRLIAPGGTIDVVARPRVVDLGGRRPVLAARVRWHVPAGPGARWWLAAGWISSSDSVQALLGRGDERAVEYVPVTARRSGVTAREHLPALDARAGEDDAVHLRLLGTGVRAGGEIRIVPAATHRVSLDAHGDTALSRRLRAAILAVSEELGQPVSAVSKGDSSDALVTLTPLDEAARRYPGQALAVDSATAASMALADTLLAHWPWIPLDHADPREVSPAQAKPLAGPAIRSTEAAPVRATLYILAMALIVLERWLALRPGRRA